MSINVPFDDIAITLTSEASEPMSSADSLHFGINFLLPGLIVTMIGIPSGLDSHTETADARGDIVKLRSEL